MKIPILLSEILRSPDFLDGNYIYNQKSVLISDVKETGGTITVSGFIKNAQQNGQTITVDTEGRIISYACSLDKDSFCEHIVALALKYNELSVEEEKPLTQLREIIKKPLKTAEEEIAAVNFNKNGKMVAEARYGSSLQRIMEKLSEDEMPMLLAVAPHLFTFRGKKIAHGTFPVNIYYSQDDGQVLFYFPAHYIYFKNCALIFDMETGEVFQFEPDHARIIDTLLSFKVTYGAGDELYGIIEQLSEKMKTILKLSGSVHIEKTSVEEARTEFLIDFEKDRMFLDIDFVFPDGKIRFKPQRKDDAQSYTLEGRLITLTANFMKKLRNAVRDAGFRLSKERFAASTQKLPAIMAEDSPLKLVGKVVFSKIVERIELDEKEIDKSEIEISLDPHDGWFSFNIRLPETVRPIPAASLADAITQIRKGVLCPVVIDEEGNPVILEKSGVFLNRVYELFVYGNALPGQRISTSYLPHLLKNKGKKTLKEFSGDDGLRSEYLDIIDKFRDGIYPEMLIHEDIKKILRPYQLEGMRWISLIKKLRLGGILADEMGLGKTLQSLAVLKNEPDTLPSIVIAPKTLVWSWDREISKFFPDMKRIVIDSYSPEERAALWKSATNELIVTSYAIVMNDLNFASQLNYETVILDEAQHIKNSATKRFKAVRELKARFRLALTGTPIENHMKDMWSIFNFLMPGFMGTRKEIERIEKTHDTTAYGEIATVAAPFILRRKKADLIPELPPVILKEYPVEMTMKQKEIYLSLLLRGRAEFLELGGDMNKMQMLALLTKLRLAANHPMMVSQNITNFEESGKIAILMELIDEIRESGGSVLVFSQFVKMLKIIEQVLKDRNLQYFYMDGSTTERGAIVDRFNAGERDIFLLSLKVGGLGLNLTGADNVIIVDPWWNPAVEEQAYSRAHRIGQSRQVVVSRLFSRETIEEKILDIQQNKKGLTDFFMDRAMSEPSKDFIRMLADMELKKPIGYGI